PEESCPSTPSRSARSALHSWRQSHAQTRALRSQTKQRPSRADAPAGSSRARFGPSGDQETKLPPPSTFFRFQGGTALCAVLQKRGLLHYRQPNEYFLLTQDLT